MNSTSASRITAAEIQAKVLELRVAGANIRVIAKAITKDLVATGRMQAGKVVSTARVHKALTDALEEFARQRLEFAPVALDLELERLDRLWLTLWADVKRGDHAAIDRAIRISERRSKLLGLDVTRVETAADDRLNELVDLMRGGPAKPATPGSDDGMNAAAGVVAAMSGAPTEWLEQAAHVASDSVV